MKDPWYEIGTPEIATERLQVLYGNLKIFQLIKLPYKFQFIGNTALTPLLPLYGTLTR